MYHDNYYKVWYPYYTTKFQASSSRTTLCTKRKPTQKETEKGKEERKQRNNVS